MIGTDNYAAPATTSYSGKLLMWLLVDLQLFLFIFPFSSFFVAMPALQGAEAMINLFSTLLIGLSLFYIAFMRKPDIPWQRAGLLFLFLAYIVLSVFWSDAETRADSISFTIRTILSIVQAFVIVVISLERGDYLFDVLKRFAIGIAVLSFLFLWIYPEQSTWTVDLAPRIQGFFSSPNNMGQFLSFAFLIINFYKTRSLPLIALLILNAILIYQLFACDSMTSFIGMLIISVTILFRFLCKPLFIVIIITGLAIPHLKNMMDSSASLDVINRDLTFSGRTEVWDIMLQDLKNRDRQWFGYGAGAYWPLDAEAMNPVSSVSQLDWDPGQGHNGYIDVLTTTGIIGLALFILFLLHFGNMFFRKKDFDKIVYLLVMIVVFNNMTESSFFRMKHFYFVLFMLMFWYVLIRYRNIDHEAALTESKTEN